jgi:hypothetical protein
MVAARPTGSWTNLKSSGRVDGALARVWPTPVCSRRRPRLRSAFAAET